MAVIGIDFNGTVVTYDYPHAIGREIGATPVLRRLVRAGHELILITAITPGKNNANHSGVSNLYDQMLGWFKDRDIPLLGVNNNPYSDPKEFPPGSKVRADLYIDDHMLGAPLWNDPAVSNRPFLDWQTVEAMLENYGYLPEPKSCFVLDDIHSYPSQCPWPDEYRYYDWALNPHGFSPDIFY